MKSSSFPLSQKYLDFINTVDGVDADFLEGTTASGKTTVGAGVKFMRMVSRSRKKLHIIASKTTGTAEKNVIQQDNGILDIHPNARYYGNGDKDYKIPHIVFEGKIIFVLGYDNRDKWELVLGSQFGCVYIDEINTANIDFVREVSTRNDYLMATLNPDDPNLAVYKEFINRSRPYKKYAADVPAEIRAELTETPVPKWRYWFFTFRDNLSLSEEDIQKKIRSAPPGTKLYKNKIQGLRGKATGLIFSNFDRKKHVVTKEHAKQFIRNQNDRHQTEWFVHFSAGLDTSYSQKSPDTISMSFIGITNRGNCYMLDEKVYNNADLGTPLAPTDTVHNFIDFLDRNRNEWGFARDTFIDSADQATITEFLKYKRLNGCVYNFNDAWKKEQIIDRIINQLNWFADAGSKPCFYIVDTCSNYIRELEVYSWLEDKDNTPEDKNDHMVNSVQYAWLPYEVKIGTGRRAS
ncbi:terminase large subunit domain-containing protein [Lacrimispora sp.]|uniref:terminase large subunit domain-containing protein n=1 Tax=Lacrimispora sp. TaxID=2719234 RepID=UPI0028A253AE|nr:terminase family protein [Lacrimispora sp.]